MIDVDFVLCALLLAVAGIGIFVWLHWMGQEAERASSEHFAIESTVPSYPPTLSASANVETSRTVVPDRMPTAPTAVDSPVQRQHQSLYGISVSAEASHHFKGVPRAPSVAEGHSGYIRDASENLDTYKLKGMLYSKKVAYYRSTGPRVTSPPADIETNNTGNTYANTTFEGDVQIWYWDAKDYTWTFVPAQSTDDLLKQPYYILPGPELGDASEETVLHVRKDGFATWVKRNTAVGYRSDERKEEAMKKKAYADGWTAAKNEQKSQSGPSRRQGASAAKSTL